MRVIFVKESWEDYEYWIKTDSKVIKKINSIIKDIKTSPFSGIGKPELLKHNYNGYWSRRITQEHRFIYKIDSGGDLIIVKLRYHYDK
ncbi:MAG: Txe/YoeB family addiction module toxin [Candidatus Kapaibacteriales bacterium]